MRRHLSLGLNEKLKLPSGLWHCSISTFTETFCFDGYKHWKAGLTTACCSKQNSCSQMARWACDKGTPRYSKTIWIRVMSFNFHWLHISKGMLLTLAKGEWRNVSIFRLSDQKYFKELCGVSSCRHISVSQICKWEVPILLSFHEKTFRKVNDSRPWH